MQGWAITSFLQMWKLKRREGKLFVQSHTASSWLSQDLNTGLLCPFFYFLLLCSAILCPLWTTPTRMSTP